MEGIGVAARSKRMLRTLSLLLALSVVHTFAAEPADARSRVEKALASMPVEAHFDQPYAGNTNHRQMLDLYLPKQRKSDKPLPVIVYIHGGGWINGDRIGGAGGMIVAAAMGNYAGVSVGYRLSNEAKWPAQIYDCKAAIRWIRGHAKEFNLDADHIGVWGTSAGGHLVSMLGTSGGVKELEGSLGEFTGVSSRVTCVINFCGPEDFTMPMMFNKDGTPAEHDPAVEGLLGGDIISKHDTAVQASPVTYVTPDDAPMLTAQGTKDQRVSFKHAERIDAALRKAGVESRFIPVTNGGHGFKSKELDKRVFQFLDQHLRGIKTEIADGPVPDEIPVKKP